MRRIAPILALAAAPVLAGEADVVDAEATRQGAAWRFDVTVRHADEGWEHYADAWEVRGEDGAVYGVRALRHPHVAEQPFTRSLSGVEIPEDVTRVVIRARDSVHGWGGREVVLELPR